MTVPANPKRRSVPTADLFQWWQCDWAYVMPDFDNANHSIIEWLSDKAPVEPSNRVPAIIAQPESAENADDRRQQPA